MLQRKYQELAKVYSKLDFIIYRKHYLIPQKPRRLFINRFIGINNNIIGSFENNLEERINAGFIMRAKDPQEKQRLIQEYHQEM